MILIDTSAWIAFFRGIRSSATDAVDRALQDGSAALAGPIVTELRRGVRSKAERGTLILHLQGCPVLPQPENLWEEAGDLGFALARHGISAGNGCCSGASAAELRRLERFLARRRRLPRLEPVHRRG